MSVNLDFLHSGETVIMQGGANMQQVLGVNKGGHLVLTNERLVFVAHKFNLGSKFDEFPISQISKTGNTLNLFLPTPNMIKLTTIDGKSVQFVVTGKQKAEWKEKITYIVGKYHSVNTSEQTPPTYKKEESSISCRKCGNRLSGDAKFCNNCGEKTEVPVMKKQSIKFCGGCGNEIKAETKFCVKCGMKQTVDEKRTIEKPKETISNEVKEKAGEYVNATKEMGTKAVDEINKFNKLSSEEKKEKVNDVANATKEKGQEVINDVKNFKSLSKSKKKRYLIVGIVILFIGIMLISGNNKITDDNIETCARFVISETLKYPDSAYSNGCEILYKKDNNYIVATTIYAQNGVGNFVPNKYVTAFVLDGISSDGTYSYSYNTAIPARVYSTDFEKELYTETYKNMFEEQE